MKIISNRIVIKSTEKTPVFYHGYLKIVALVMIIQFIYYGLQKIFDLNFNADFSNHLGNSAQYIYQFLGFLFFYSVPHILVCIITSISLFVMRTKLRLSFLYLVAGISYCYLLYWIDSGL